MDQKVRDNIEKVALKVLGKRGLDLYDIEYPAQPGGTLRIAVWKASEPMDEQGRRKGVNLDECAKISREIDGELEFLLPEDFHFMLEVSTPGIERNLSRREHFLSATDETIKAVLKVPKIIKSGKKLSILKGKLTEVQEEDFTLTLDNGEPVQLTFAELKKANVLFDFGRV